jgi:S1-C subfamily serine protease
VTGGMTGSVLFDIVLLLVLVAYLAYGWMTGFIRGLGSLAGIIVGAIAALLAVPFITPWVPLPGLRVAAVLLITLVLIGAGQTLGAWLGRSLSAPLHRTPLKVVDRILGALATVSVAALVLSLIAAGISGLGVPVISTALGSSVVIRTIDSVTPDPVKAVMAQARSAVFDTGFLVISRALGMDAESTAVPEVDTTTEEISAASASVVRITGTAFSCGRYQTGSGFVVAKNRVITNAHVVAGVAEPVVESRSGQSLPGQVVYFDPAADLAVIAVPGLDVNALPVAASLEVDNLAVTAGFPWGGPFAVGGARVIDVSELPITDIYGGSAPPRAVYTLAATVVEGDSGGPLLSLDGEVVGAIFARGESGTTVGYAVTMDVVGPVISQSRELTRAVDSGPCVSRD